MDLRCYLVVLAFVVVSASATDLKLPLQTSQALANKTESRQFQQPSYQPQYQHHFQQPSYQPQNQHHFQQPSYQPQNKHHFQQPSSQQAQNQPIRRQGVFIGSLLASIASAFTAVGPVGIAVAVAVVGAVAAVAVTVAQTVVNTQGSGRGFIDEHSDAWLTKALDGDLLKDWQPSNMEWYETLEDLIN